MYFEQIYGLSFKHEKKWRMVIELSTGLIKPVQQIPAFSYKKLKTVKTRTEDFSYKNRQKL